jgi:molecular chaperone DnaK
MYQASQAGAEAGAAEGGASKNEDVVDADFEEVDDDKKKSA